MKFTNRLTYANVVSTVALVLAIAGGGTAYALAKNSVGSPQIIDKSIKAKDLGKGSVKTGKIANGAVAKGKLSSAVRAQLDDAISPWDTIPSGRTVTGRYLGNAPVWTHHLIELPARAPVALATPVVTGASGNATCTGSYANPTAPAGKVCIYHSSGPVSTAFVLTEHTHFAFFLHVNQAGYYYGSWAYRAP